MARWKWEGFNKDGKRMAGGDEAPNELELRRSLKNRGIRPIKVTPPSFLEMDLSQWMIDNGFAKAYTAKDLAGFTRQFSTMLDAGIPILQCLEIIMKQEKNPTLKLTIKNLSKDVGEGKTLSESM